MANAITEPAADTSLELTLSENSELYWCPAADTLDAADLIPNTQGDMDVAPTTQTERIRLHNGKDYVASSREAGADVHGQHAVAGHEHEASRAVDRVGGGRPPGS